MNNLNLHKLLNYGIAAIWIVNGLYCKLLNMVPRHQLIVSSILGSEHAKLLTMLIGISEIIMAIWIISRFKSKLNTITQLVIIASMNMLEFMLVPELLLWGKFNAIFAAMLMLTIYYNEFVLNKKIMKTT